MDFESSFVALLAHEGGLTMDREDRGNWTGGQIGAGVLRGTKYGISAAAYPTEDIAGLTVERAKLLYRRDYWGPAGCDLVPDAIKFDLFDAAVNSGVRAAVRMLQRSVGAVADGVLGPQTLLAVSNMDPAKALLRFNAGRLAIYVSHPAWSEYGRGWVIRVANNLMRA
jgi:lysozyme family protein